MNILMTLLAFGVLFLLVSAYTNRPAESADVDRAAYIGRLFYSDVLMYNDAAASRVYPGIVDIEKCTDERLNAIFNEEVSPNAPAKMSSFVQITVEEGCSIQPKSCYNNKATYQLREPQSIERGAGASTKQTVVYPVTVRRQGASCAGMLNITVVRANA